MRRTVLIVGLSLVASATSTGCGEDEVIEPERDNRKPVIAEDPPPPISGGTLTITSSGVALVADSDRDRVSVVSLSPGAIRQVLTFERDAEPGRVIEGSPGIGHVILRGTGEVASFDIESGDLLSRRYVCVDPRGLEYAAVVDRLYVACADGTLAHAPEDAADGELVRDFLEPDLRDVVVAGNRLLVSRMRSAEILEVPLDSTFVISRRSPPNAGTAQPTVAWRMRRMGDTVLLLHQYAETTPIATSTPPPVEDEPPPPPAYGGGGSFEDCEPSIVRPALTTIEDGERFTRDALSIPSPTVDVAMSSNGSVAVAIAGAAEGEPNVDVDGLESCGGPNLRVPGQPIAVAWTDDGRLVVQSREPGELYVFAPDLRLDRTIQLSGNSRFDTGHDLFHRATEAQIACASCHPSGADDGHVWNFEGLGPRRSQNLSVGLADSAPFHWDGDQNDIQTLANTVYTNRMGGPLQSDERAAAFEGWLFSLQGPDAGSMSADLALSERGEEVFTELGCNTCHGGDRLATNATVQIRGKSLQVPSLRRVALRPPFMHDGRAPTLRSAIIEMIDSTVPGADVSSSDVSALESYLSTR